MPPTASAPLRESPLLGELPAPLRTLRVVGRRGVGRRLVDALILQIEQECVEAIGIAEGICRLREELFDVVFVGHEGPSLDALELLSALETGVGPGLAVVVLEESGDDRIHAACLDAGADACLCTGLTTPQGLLLHVARSIERQRLLAENRRLQQAHHHKLRLEHDEANRLLDQQRSMIGQLERIRADAGRAIEADCGAPRVETAYAAGELPDTLAAHYRELLRLHVMMGSGNLGGEVRRVADAIAAADQGPQALMRLHIAALEELLRGLGRRSSRHVINRADLLVLEVMMHLAEGRRAEATP